jgi:DNA-binding NarL/FixJ family response regulator
MTVRALIADDQALVRAGFRKLLESEPDIEIAAEVPDGLEAVEVTRRLQPDVVLMDIRMPVLDGLEATRRILRQGTKSRVLMLTTYDLDEYVFDALRAGASGFLLKDAPPDQLIAAIHVVARGDALLAPSITRRLIEEFARRPSPRLGLSPELAGLTTREIDVLKLLAGGLSNAEIAAKLFLGEATVKTHVSNMLMKLGLRDRVQAVVLAYESGLVQPGTLAERNQWLARAGAVNIPVLVFSTGDDPVHTTEQDILASFQRARIETMTSGAEIPMEQLIEFARVVEKFGAELESA